MKNRFGFALFMLLLLPLLLWAKDIGVTWNTNSESDLAGYGVYDNGSLVGNADVSSTPSYTIPGVADGEHSVTVDAYDTSGNRSEQSDPSIILVDSIPPGQPAEPDVAINGDKATLTWKAGVESDLAGYGIYIDGVLIETIAKPESPTYATGSLADGEHTFAIDAVDSSDNRSAISESATAIINISAPAKPTGVKTILKN